MVGRSFRNSLCGMGLGPIVLRIDARHHLSSRQSKRLRRMPAALSFTVSSWAHISLNVHLGLSHDQQSSQSAGMPSSMDTRLVNVDDIIIIIITWSVLIGVINLWIIFSNISSRCVLFFFGWSGPFIWRQLPITGDDLFQVHVFTLMATSWAYVVSHHSCIVLNQLIY